MDDPLQCLECSHWKVYNQKCEYCGWEVKTEEKEEEMERVQAFMYPERFTLQCTQCDSRDTRMDLGKDEGVFILLLKCHSCGHEEEVY